MPESVLLDNDVALKISCYSLVEQTTSIVAFDEAPPAMLGVGRFVIRNRLERSSNVSDVTSAKDAFERLLQTTVLLEPNDEELAIAADLEEKATRQGLELDGGESQLVAILMKRACELLITGDKRAIAALEKVASDLVAGRVACLEQLIAQIVHLAGVAVVRPRICREPKVDRALTSCFGCSQVDASKDDVVAGLSSYIGHLGRSAPGVLFPGSDLSSIVT